MTRLTPIQPPIEFATTSPKLEYRRGNTTNCAHSMTADNNGSTTNPIHRRAGGNASASTTPSGMNMTMFDTVSSSL